MIDAGYTTLSSRDLRQLLRGSSPARRLAIWRDMPLMFQLGAISDAAEELQIELDWSPVRLAIVREFLADIDMMKKIHKQVTGEDFDAEPTQEHDHDRAS